MVFKTRHYESIIQDIREAITLQDSKKPIDTSSGSSSESDAEVNHKPARRCISDQHCNVTVSVRPRRTHSERVIHQVAVGRSPSIKPCSKAVSISPTFFVNTNNNVLKVPNSSTEESQEGFFDFEDQATSMIISSRTGAANWKTSQTFSKTMIEVKSDNESSSTEFADSDVDRHSYIDIIGEKKIEEPLTSDAASTLLAQVVADLTEPQKKSCFTKSMSTGGMQTTLPVVSETRRASAPAVATRDLDFPPTLESDTQDVLAASNRKFRLEKINEVSFTETSNDGEKLNNHLLSLSNGATDRGARPRSMSERLSPGPGSPVVPSRGGKKRSKTTLFATQSVKGSSLTDLRTGGSPQKHMGLKSTLSSSSMQSVSHQLARDPLSFGFASGSGKVPSFPKRSVVKAVECVGGLDNSRTKLNMSPLPKEFHCPGHNDFIELERRRTEASVLISQLSCDVPPRPPKDADSKPPKKSGDSQGSPPPLPERFPSPTATAMSPRDRTFSPKLHWSPESLNRPYANTPPKVQPRTPNAMPLQSSALSEAADIINPPPRPPKPLGSGFSSKRSNAQSFNASSPPPVLLRRIVSERRTECYSWEIDHNATGETAKESSPQLERIKNPIVMVTPPRSPIVQRALMVGPMSLQIYF